MKASMRCLAVMAVGLLGSSSLAKTSLEFNFTVQMGFKMLDGQLD